MALLLSQQRINVLAFRFNSNRILLFLFLHDQVRDSLLLLQVFRYEVLVLLVLIEQTHSQFKILSLLLVTRSDDLIKQLFLFFVHFQ